MYLARGVVLALGESGEECTPSHQNCCEGIRFFLKRVSHLYSRRVVRTSLSDSLSLGADLRFSRVDVEYLKSWLASRVSV